MHSNSRLKCVVRTNTHPEQGLQHISASRRKVTQALASREPRPPEILSPKAQRPPFRHPKHRMHPRTSMNTSKPPPRSQSPPRPQLGCASGPSQIHKRHTMKWLLILSLTLRLT